VGTVTGSHVLPRAPDDEALALYRAIVANSTEAIAIVDPSGVYLEQNAAHYTLLGYADDELRGRTPALHMGEQVFGEVAAELAGAGGASAR